MLIGGFVAGPADQWDGYENRFYFRAEMGDIGVPDVGFTGSSKILLEIPSLDPGRYRIVGGFHIEGQENEEWHYDEFEVVE